MSSPDLTGQRVEVPPDGKVGTVVRHEPCEACTRLASREAPRRLSRCGYDDVIVQFGDGTTERHYEPEVTVRGDHALDRVSVLSPEYQRQEERMPEQETTFGTQPVEAADTITGETEESPAEPESQPQEESSPAEPETAPEPESDAPDAPDEADAPDAPDAPESAPAEPEDAPEE